MAVLWHHSQPNNLPLLLTRGFLGVDMFFVLSGFLIVTLLLREKSKTQTVALQKFYSRRFLRIFPAYYGLLLCLTILYSTLRIGTESSLLFFGTLPWNLAFLSNCVLVQANGLGSMWSLAIEQQFYLIWPVFEKYLKPRLIYGILGVGVVINQVINMGVANGAFNKPHWFPDATFTPICLGICLAHAFHHASSFNKLLPLMGWRHAPLMWLGLLLVTLYISPSDIFGWPRLSIQVLMLLLLGSLVMREDHCLKSLLSYPPVVRVGQISYGIYLYHLWIFSIVGAIVQVAQSYMQITLPLPLFITGSLASIAISELSYRFYEMPFLNLKKKFSW
ncbi:acyltransferase [Alkalinema sp. FACHB-956]|nr:acyltransferase [Alkalinema sp. FACHB-956]